MNKKFALIFLVVGILLLVFVLSFFMVRQDTLGTFQSGGICQSVLQDKCISGYACTSCSLTALPYSVKFDDGTVTNKVYSADCVYGSSNVGSGHTACVSSGNVVSHVKSHCYGNDVFWFNSLNQRETIKTQCPYRCDDYTLDSARCISAPSCSSQGQSCGSPSLPSCCSGLSCQNFGCYPITSPVCIVGQHKCTSPNAYTLCVYGSDGVAKWDTVTPRFCPANQICDSTSDLFKYCKVDTLPPISYPVCDASGSMLCLSDAQFFNGEIVGCTGTDCPNGCVNNACVSTPVTCDVSSICSSDTVVKTTNSDCTTVTKSCASGSSCSDGSCIKNVPPVDKCLGVVCPNDCTADYSYRSLGSCDSGNCVYGKVELMSTQCIGEPAECTVDKFELDCNNNNVKTASCVDGKYVYIIGRADCKQKSFFSQYGLWIAGSIFLLSLILFIIYYIPKKVRRR
jgi:hypothetical protein